MRVEYRNLGARPVPQDVLCIDQTFGSFAGLKPHRPWEMRRIVKRQFGGRHEKLWHFLLVHVRADRQVGGSAPDTHGQQNLVLFHELVRQRYRLAGVGAGIEADELDLAPVDAAVLVDHLKVSRLGAPGCAILRERAAIRHDVADLDFRIRCARVVFGLRRRRRGGTCEYQQRRDRKRKHSGACSHAMRNNSSHSIDLTVFWFEQRSSCPAHRRSG